MFRSSNNSSIYIVSIRFHASVVALHSGVVVEVLDMLYHCCSPPLCYSVCIAASPLSLAITLNVACLLSLAIILDVDLFCIWKSRINQLVLGPQLMFDFPIYGSSSVFSSKSPRGHSEVEICNITLYYGTRVVRLHAYF